MVVDFAEALMVPKGYEEEVDPERIKTIQLIPYDIYFVDDIVSIKILRKDVPAVGRISKIDRNVILLDCSRNFKLETKEIKRDEIESIKMWDCPENVLVRRHVKGV